MDRRRAQRTNRVGRRIGPDERDDVLAAGAQRSDERPAEQPRPSGDERARQGWPCIVGCAASRLPAGATVVSAAPGIAGTAGSSAEARRAEEKLMK